MIFTLAGNRRRVADAAAKAREEGIAIGRQEIRQQMAEWYAAAKSDLAAGRFPDPPPILVEDGGGSPSN